MNEIYPRCVTVWLSCIKAEITQKTYLYYFEKFRSWAKIDSYEDLLKADSKSIQRLIEDYVLFLRDTISPNSINSQIAPIFLFFQVNDVVLNLVKIRKMFPEKVKRSGLDAYTREDVQSMLENTIFKRTKAVILIFASTGCRVGGLVELKIADVESMPNGCKCLTFYKDYKEEYYGFLTPEASEALDDYLKERESLGEKLTPQSPLIRARRTVLPKQCSIQMIAEIIETSLNGHTRERGGTGRFKVQTLHGFRKYFNVIMKLRPDVNLSLCEKLMGHSVTISLDNHYLPATKEQLFEEFSKAIPALTVDRKIRLEEQLNLKDAKYKRQETEKDKRIKDLETLTLNLSFKVEELHKRMGNS